MDISPISWYEWFLMVLNVVADSITTLLSMLPNPDPFPGIMQNISFDYVDGYRVAWYWLDSAIEMELFLSVLTAWFEMFALGWIIQMLWKWLKAR